MPVIPVNPYEITQAFTEGQTVISGAEHTRRNKLLAAQLNATLYIVFAGRVLAWPDDTAFEVSAGAGLSVDIEPGAGVAPSETYGGVLLARETSYNKAGLPDDSTFTLFAAIDLTDGTPGSNDSRESRLPEFIDEELDTLDGAIALAEITTLGGVVTSVVDKRKLYAPIHDRGPWDADADYLKHDAVEFNDSYWVALQPSTGETPTAGANWRQLGGGSNNADFGQDEATTAGLDLGIFGGLIRASDGSLLDVAADIITLDDNEPSLYIEIDETGTLSFNNTAWTLTKRPIGEATTLGGAITSYTPRQIGFDFTVAANAVTNVTGSGGIASSGGTTPNISIADNGVTDAKIGNRTVDQTLAAPGNTGPLLSLLSWIVGRIKAITGETNWYDAPDVTLATTKIHIDAAAPHTGHMKADGTVAATANQNAGGFKITNLANGVAATDAATVGQIATAAAGFAPRLGVRVATAAALPANTRTSNTLTANANGNINNTGVDGITNLAVGNRVLVKDEAVGANIGVYEIVTLGNAGAPWTMTRAADFDNDADAVLGAYYPVTEGATNNNTSWYLSTSGAITLNTTALTFTRDVRAGDGEANTASNINTEGVGVFDSKSGVDLRMRGVYSVDNKITVALNGLVNAIAFTLNEANLTLQNLGGVLTGAKGGTGQSTTTLGDLLIGAAANTWAKFPGNSTATRKYLMMVSSVASWVGQIPGSDVETFGASGVSHKAGVVPTPGATAGTTRSLHEDGTWKVSSGGGYKATSTSNRSVGLGSKTFTIQPGLAYTPGVIVRASYQTDLAYWMEGICTDYNSVSGNITITMERTGTIGGPFALWNLNVVGEPGTIDSSVLIGSTATGTIYVDAATGNDTTGDGTAALPYATVAKARSVLPDVILHATNIYVNAGTYAEAFDFTGLGIRAAFAIEARNLAGTALYYNSQASSGSTTTIVKTGAGWPVNAWAGAKVYATAGAGASQIATVISNTSDTLTFAAVSTAFDSTTQFTITGLVKFNLTGITNFSALTSQPSVTIRGAWFDASTATAVSINSGSVLTISHCYFNAGTNGIVCSAFSYLDARNCYFSIASAQRGIYVDYSASATIFSSTFVAETLGAGIGVDGRRGSQIMFSTSSANRCSFVNLLSGVELVTIAQQENVTLQTFSGCTTPHTLSVLQGSALVTNFRNVTASTVTLVSTDHTVTLDTTSNNITATLPTAVGAAGRRYRLKRTSGGANTVTINTTSAQTIDGATSRTLTAQYQWIEVESDGANWMVVDETAAAGGGGGYSDPAFVSGLELEYVNATQVKVKSGSCYIEDPAAAYSASIDTTLTPTLAASDIHYVYAYNNSGSLGFEVSTTEPAAAYRGNARSKTGDNTRRYIGQFVTNASSQIYNFLQQDTVIKFREGCNGAPFRVLNNGSATSQTNVSCGGILPVTSRIMSAHLINVGGNTVYFGTSDDWTSSGVSGILGNSPGQIYFVDFPLDSSQQFQYVMSGAGGGSYVDVYGYRFVR